MRERGGFDASLRLSGLLRIVAAQRLLIFKKLRSSIGFDNPFCRAVLALNTLLPSEELEISFDEAFATVQPSKGNSKVRSRFSLRVEFFLRVWFAAELRFCGAFFHERKDLIFIM